MNILSSFYIKYKFKNLLGYDPGLDIWGKFGLYSLKYCFTD